MRGMRGLGFTKHVGTGGVLDVCLCLGYGGVGGECVGAWTRVWSGGVVYVCVSCESVDAGPGICILCFAATRASLVHPVFNPVAPYNNNNIYLYICFIPCICLWHISQIHTCCGCWTYICLDITSFYEEQRQSSSGCTWPDCPKTVNRAPHCWGREVYAQLHSSFTVVTFRPLVGCLVWSPANTIFTNIILHAVKHNISKGKIHSTCKQLPEYRNIIKTQVFLRSQS